MNMQSRPPSLPKCEHGRADILRCEQCRAQKKIIGTILQPLADEFWEHARTANRSIEHMLYRAYRMGMKHEDGDI